MSLIAKMKFDPSRPIIGRSMSRAVCGSLHFMISSAIQQSIRRERFGTTVPEAGGVDAMNTAVADADARAEAERVRAEQGFEVDVDPLELAARLKTIRDELAEDLANNAQMRASVTSPGVSFPDPFHLAGTFEESLKFQVSLGPRISDAAVQAEAEALNVEPEAVREAIRANHNRQIQFLQENLEDIVTAYKNLPSTDDGDAELAFAKLPPIVQLRLAAKADAGLYNARGREIQSHLRGGPRALEAKGNVALIDGTRRDLLAEVQAWMKNDGFKDQVASAVERGQSMPSFSPEPHVQKPDMKDKAMEQHKRTGTTG